MKNTAVCSPWQEAQDIVENIQTPVIPERQFCLKAVSGSEIRAALQNLLDECSESGGGKVVVPRGVYRCDGPLKLKSFTELHFEDPDTFEKATRDEIKSGGYVVHTLEAAIWCLLNTKSYKECVLTAVNLGDDTDTVAAIAGGLAGAMYGYESIPKEWLDTLIKRDYIEEMCEKAFNNWK